MHRNYRMRRSRPPIGTACICVRSLGECDVVCPELRLYDCPYAKLKRLTPKTRRSAKRNNVLVLTGYSARGVPELYVLPVLIDARLDVDRMRHFEAEVERRRREFWATHKRT